MQVETLDATVRNYINELETYKQRYQQIETRNKELEISLKEFQYKYLEIKEQYDLLVYKRFARSAEQLLEDEKQSPLFTEEVKQKKNSQMIFKRLNRLPGRRAGASRLAQTYSEGREL